jgi:hypothetical protein
MRLPKNESDDLFQVTITSGLVPTEFTLRRGIDWSGIYHEESVSHLLVKPFLLNSVRRARAASTSRFPSLAYNVRVMVRGGRETLYQGIGWANVRRLALGWGREVGTQNAWAGSDQAKDAFTAADGEETGNAPFTEGEQRQIAAQLQDIEKYLKEEINLPGEQIAQIEEKLDEVAEASKRMGRKDWLVYFLGAITALIITATVAAPVGEHIFTMVIHGLAHLFTDGNEPPQIPPRVIT